MERSSWKRTERRVAAALGGERVPVSGRARGDVPDVRHPLWAIEVKHRKRLPALLAEAMSQAVAAQRDGQVPLVVLHETGRHQGNDLVVLRMSDWIDLHGPAVPEVE